MQRMIIFLFTFIFMSETVLSEPSESVKNKESFISIIKNNYEKDTYLEEYESYVKKRISLEKNLLIIDSYQSAKPKAEPELFAKDVIDLMYVDPKSIEIDERSKSVVSLKPYQGHNDAVKLITYFKFNAKHEETHEFGNADIWTLSEESAKKVKEALIELVKEVQKPPKKE